MTCRLTFVSCPATWLLALVCASGCEHDLPGAKKNEDDRLVRDTRVGAPNSVDVSDMGEMAISAEKATLIAVEAVRGQEGWVGKADRPVLYEDKWYVVVWREPRVFGGDRTIIMSKDGRIIKHLHGR
jgi:hypothetical protein